MNVAPPIARPQKRLPSRVVLTLWIVASLGAGVVGSMVSGDAVGTWYRSLERPSFTPPGAVFGPVWTVLYILMGIAAWKVWRSNTGPHRQAALVLFGAHLAVNAAWSGIFFGWRNPGAAFAWILLLDGLVATVLVLFARIDRAAAWLLAPYAAWLGFATILNFEFWRLNAA